MRDHTRTRTRTKYEIMLFSVSARYPLMFLHAYTVRYPNGLFRKATINNHFVEDSLARNESNVVPEMMPRG